MALSVRAVALIAAAVVVLVPAPLSGCSGLEGCRGSIDTASLSADIERRFPQATGITVDRSDCDSGGVPLVYFELVGGKEAARRELARDQKCRLLEADRDELFWRCDVDGVGEVFYSYSSRGYAKSR